MEPPTHFKDMQNELTQRYNIIIDEVVKTYPSYKTNPMSSNDYKQNIQNLEKLQEDIFLMKNNLSKSTDKLQKNIKVIDDKIFTLEEENKAFQEELDLLTNSDNAAHGRLTDSKTLYKQQLVGNFILFIYLLYMVYTRR
jgi:septation ring formation regulator EzrA